MNNEIIDKYKLKDKLLEYFNIGSDCDFYILTRDKSAFEYGTMSFSDFKEFDEEQVNDIINFLFNENNTKDASYDIFFEEHKEEVEEIRKICEEIANDKKLMKKLKKIRKKLNAEELFESLGYRKFENEYWIYYSKETDGTYPVDRIYFVKNTKEIKAETFTYDKTLTKNVTTSELQAINQQCKELGWLDE